MRAWAPCPNSPFFLLPSRTSCPELSRGSCSPRTTEPGGGQSPHSSGLFPDHSLTPPIANHLPKTPLLDPKSSKVHTHCPYWAGAVIRPI